jgi:hypothetical protein
VTAWQFRPSAWYRCSSRCRTEPTTGPASRRAGLPLPGKLGKGRDQALRIKQNFTTSSPVGNLDWPVPDRSGDSPQRYGFPVREKL